MPICVCGKELKTDLGAKQHGGYCKQYKKNKLAGGTGLVEIPENNKAVEDARKQLREEVIPLAMSTLMAALSGNNMKESRVRAAVQIIKMVGVNKETPPKAEKVTVKFGEMDDNELAVDEDEDEGPIEGVVDQKVG